MPKSVKSYIAFCYRRRSSNYIRCLHAMRHSRRYQAIPVLYRSLGGYSDACTLQRHTIPREETRGATLTVNILI